MELLRVFYMTAPFQACRRLHIWGLVNHSFWPPGTKLENVALTPVNLAPLKFSSLLPMRLHLEWRPSHHVDLPFCLFFFLFPPPFLFLSFSLSFPFLFHLFLAPLSDPGGWWSLQICLCPMVFWSFHQNYIILRILVTLLLIWCSSSILQ